MTANVIVVKCAKTERYTSIWGICNGVYWTNPFTTLARTLENRHYFHKSQNRIRKENCPKLHSC